MNEVQGKCLNAKFANAKNVLRPSVPNTRLGILFKICNSILLAVIKFHTINVILVKCVPAVLSPLRSC